jgi:DNA polymerase-3 subunit epsilon
MSDVAAATRNRPLAFVDLETTGGDPRHHRVIEVGVVELDADGASREWSTLVNPGCRIPAYIEEFTGISNAMVEDAPAFARVADEVERRLAGRLFVAHNARFDYGFLCQEFRRLERRLRADVLCTVKLSRLLYPGEPRHNLDAVMERHGLTTTARHRALGDARVLSDLWQALNERWKPEELAAVVAQLSRRPTLPEHLPAELIDELPDGPGVYRFHGADDALLYVGKAKSIRARVLGHIAAGAGGGKDAKLVRLVRRIDWTETAGELGALLLEARLIKSEKPVFNRRLRGNDTLFAIELVEASGWLQAQVVPFDPTAASASRLFGLFRRRADGERALAEIVRSQQLCAKCLGRETAEGSCFGFQVGRCRGACVGREPPARHNVRLQMALAALRIPTWPFAGAIAVTERDAAGQAQAHVFDRWSYLGTADGRTAGDEETVRRLVRTGQPVFDPDIYRLLRSFLAHAPRHAVRELPTVGDARSAFDAQ